jgi:hypothetical protein
MAPTRVTIVAGSDPGAQPDAAVAWTIDRIVAVRGEALPSAVSLRRIEGAEPAPPPPAGGWTLQGVRSHDRYLERGEKDRLVAVQEDLGRPSSAMAALIPMRKSAAWWAMTQDERRAVFETRSRHIAIGSQYLPAIARRLYHCRDLGEPFDFLTWFEFSPAEVGAFDDLLGRLRETEEWRYVDREVEVRLQRTR